MKEIDIFYLEKEEPVKSCLLSLREHLLNYNPNITEAWKFNMPFFCYKGNMICYLWTHKKTGLPFIGFRDGKWIEHPALTFEDRSRIKIFLIDPKVAIPFDTIDSILKIATGLYD